MESSRVDPQTWKPKRTHEECDEILTAPGGPLEIEHITIDGRQQRSYKHQPPSIRHFWVVKSHQYAIRTYIVFERERYTYAEIHQKASRAADVLSCVYDVQKGDRVGIVMRNYPEWIVVWWAIQLLGALPVCVNAWLPKQTIQYCVLLTDCKAVILDPQRALLLEDWLSDAVDDPGCILSGALVVRHWELQHKGWEGVQVWDDVMSEYPGPYETWKKGPSVEPEDSAAIFFTSGTTGMPKGVVSTHRAFLTNVPSRIACRAHAMLRNGFEVPVLDSNAPQSAGLLTSPLFHVTGATNSLMLHTLAGSRLCMMRKWDRETAAKLIVEERIESLSGVPFTLMDLAESSLVNEIRALPSMTWSLGGASPPVNLVNQMSRQFPNTQFIQSYGLTELNAMAAGVAGPDYVLKPSSAGRATPVNDIIIVDLQTGCPLPPGEAGEIWIRGPNVMKGYWKDPQATSQAITEDGWFKTGDLGSLDDEGFLYIRDRIKDLIIRGGENIDSSTIENVLHSDTRLLDCAAVAVPDRKFGELPAAVVGVKEAFRGGELQERELITLARNYLPSFAVPVMVIILDHALPRNATGKVMKQELRTLAKAEWEWRKKLTQNFELARL